MRQFIIQKCDLLTIEIGNRWIGMGDRNGNGNDGGWLVVVLLTAYFNKLIVDSIHSA